jgi:DNA (cytosine-5)-methyltransferase 1
MKILNLYAGIGGNRKLWGDEHEITSIECDPDTIDVYKHFFPNDEVILADAHLYLIENFQNYDFIWSSPPCPTHTRFNFLTNNIPEKAKKYPDMKLYEEIIFLQNFYKTGLFVIENVISYYKPLIEPTLSDNHYFWSNFEIPFFEKSDRKIRGTVESFEYKQKRNGFNLDRFPVNKTKKRTMINNCVLPELGKAILDNAKAALDDN